jgi:hypothetical protein
MTFFLSVNQAKSLKSTLKIDKGIDENEELYCHLKTKYKHSSYYQIFNSTHS